MQLDMAIRNHPVSRQTMILSWSAWLTLSLLILLPAAAHCTENRAGVSGAGNTNGTNDQSKAKNGNKAGKCIANICLETSITQKDIVAKYGPGRTHVSGGKPLETVTRCYYDPKQDLYIEFNFDKHLQEMVRYNSDLAGIMVSLIPMCPKRYKPTHSFPRLSTEYGLTIGSTEAEVRTAMGKPNMVQDMAEVERSGLSRHTHEELMRAYDTPDYGETALFYNPDPEHNLLFNYFYISQGKVKSIHLNASE